MNKIVTSILLLGSLMLTGCNNNNETSKIRKQWNNEEITYIDTNLNFTNGSSYVPCYVIDEQVEFKTLSGPIGFSFTTLNATNEDLEEYKSLLVSYSYQYDLEKNLYTLNVSADNYFAINPTLNDEILEVFVYNNLKTSNEGKEVRRTWTTSEVEMFNTYFFNGASDLVPCFVPNEGELTDSYFSEYECLSVEAITEDETLVDTYLDIIFDFGYVEEYDSDYEMYTYYYDIDENSYMNIDCYYYVGLFTIDIYYYSF